MTKGMLTLFGVSASRWLVLGVLGLGLVALSVLIRTQLEIAWDVQSLRAFVEGLGLWGPLAFIGILTFRFVFLVPTELLLLAGGIVFGPVEGTLYAGLGITESGLLKYGFVSIIGRDFVLRQLPLKAQNWALQIATRKMSALGLAGVCAYPFFPKHVFQLAAILSGMGFTIYMIAVFAGGLIRAAIFSNVGEAIYGGTGLMVTTGILAGSVALPLCIPPWRRWLLAPLNSNSTDNSPPETQS